jgi:hypothetical protein
MSIQHNLSARTDFGDFQTPDVLAERICAILVEHGITPHTLIEPTFGTGAFLRAGLKHFPSLRTIVGLEIHQPYYETVRANLDMHSRSFIRLECQDIFATDFRTFLPSYETPTLILGNPPWVTNAALQGANLPIKTNIKRLRGIDALTGMSNFDIAEYITIKLLRECKGENVTLALLLKNSVIRNLIQFAPQLDLPISEAKAFTIDAKKFFGVAVAASLFVCKCNPPTGRVQCTVQNFDNEYQPKKTFGWYANGQNRFVADIEAYSSITWLEGKSPCEWRQGIKHDAASVMELTRVGVHWVNKLGEIVDAEEEYIFPLVKSTQAARSNGTITDTNHAVIIPQRTIGEDTSTLAHSQPRLYAYLESHEKLFAARKSSIYNNKPKFSIFGIGSYSFKPYKVAVSGLHKNPIFVLISPVAAKPVMLDDTSYFLGFDTLAEATSVQYLLQSSEVASFLAATTFLDAKRPYTKELLMRIDIGRLTEKYAQPELHYDANYSLKL